MSTLLDCQELALEKKGECLSHFYKNNTYPMYWKCRNKHEWIMSVKKIKKGLWCEKCNTNSLKESYITLLCLILS